MIIARTCMVILMALVAGSAALPKPESPAVAGDARPTSPAATVLEAPAVAPAATPSSAAVPASAAATSSTTVMGPFGALNSHALSNLGRALGYVNHLLPFDDEQSRDSDKKELASILADIEGPSRRMVALEARLGEQVRGRLGSLPPAAHVGVKMALYGHPFPEKPLDNLRIEEWDDKADISKTGGVDTYDACIDRVLADGTALALKFSLGTKDFGGIPPVTYFSLRDERGLSLMLLQGPPDPKVVHEVLLTRTGMFCMVFYDKQPMKLVRIERLTGNIYACFHMPFTAHLVLSGIRVIPAEPPGPAE
jgi:hypothetical protein